MWMNSLLDELLQLSLWHFYNIFFLFRTRSRLYSVLHWNCAPHLLQPASHCAKRKHRWVTFFMMCVYDMCIHTNRVTYGHTLIWHSVRTMNYIYLHVVPSILFLKCVKITLTSTACCMEGLVGVWGHSLSGCHSSVASPPLSLLLYAFSTAKYFPVMKLQ